MQEQSLGQIIRKFVPLIVLAVVVIVMSQFVGCTKVEPGYVGIKVNQYGTQKGVSDFPIQTGRVWYNPATTEIYKFPTFMQNVVWTKSPHEGNKVDESITFNSVEGANANADIGLSYSFNGAKVPEIFIKFRQDAAHITEVFVRNHVRDAFVREASTMKITEIFGAGKQILLGKVAKGLRDVLGPDGIDVESVALIGELRVDASVAQSINAVITANQKATEAENKVRQSKAEAEQAMAVATGKAQAILTEASAQAEANKKIRESLTAELVQIKAIEKWDGVLPTYTGGGAVPFINIDKK
jgi:regulator of protease activity HflC (stomatin/prohibitin superfamily)